MTVSKAHAGISVSRRLCAVAASAGPPRRPHVGDARFLGIAPRSIYQLPLLRIGALSVLLTRETPDSGWDERFDTEIVSSEHTTRVRGKGGRGRGRDELLNQLPSVVGDRWCGREFTVAPYERDQQGADRWQAGAESVGARLHFPRSEAGAGPTDKIAVRAWLDELDVPAPRSVVTQDVDYPSLRRLLGDVFVVQRPRGAGGKGTFLVTSEDTAAALPGTDQWLASAYCGDTTVNVHGFVTSSGIALALRPSVQLTNIEGIGARFGQYCGSDFRAPAHLNPTAMSRCHDTVERIGRALSERGYRGVFGVDFAVGDDTAVALEINYRAQGSTWLLGEVELAAGTSPTMLRDILERHGHATNGPCDLTAAPATQLIIRHSGRPGRIRHVPRGGIYRLDGHQLRWRTSGYGLLECGPDDCAVLNLPAADALVYSRAILARLVTPQPVTTATGTTLTEHGQRLVGALHQLLAIEPLSDDELDALRRLNGEPTRRTSLHATASRTIEDPDQAELA